MEFEKDGHKINICCVFNYNPLYRLPIYKEIDKYLHADFFFGDSVFEPIKQFDPSELKGFKGFIKARRLKIKGFIWHSDIKKIFNTNYTHYILTGDSSCLVNWLILLYCLFFRKKVFLWCHGLRSEVHKLKTKLFLKLFYKSATGILLYNHYSEPYMKKIGLKESQLHVIHNSLDTTAHIKIMEQNLVSNCYDEHFLNHYPTILYIGRIQKRKKIEQILEAMKLLNQRNTPVNLVVVGGVTNDFNFSNSVNDLGLQSQVWLYGPSYDERVNAELIYNAKVCVSPGNVGLTCIHSLTFGTPVVTNDNLSTQMPEFEAIIDNKTGSFFKEDDIDSLAEHIHRWCSISNEEREEVRRMCKETILREWSVDYQINLLNSIL